MEYTVVPEYFLTRSTDVLGEDLFREELVAEARLDAMLDRATKRLVQAKAVKQMLGRSLESPQSKVQSRPPNESDSTGPKRPMPTNEPGK